MNNTKKAQKNPKLAPKYDPIWRVDFQDLKIISPTAFIIRQLLRLSRDLETNLTTLSDSDIQKETGFNRKTIREARRELINAGFFVQQGYHTLFVRPFRWTESVQPTENQLDIKCPTLGQNMSNQLDRKCPTVGQKVSNPIIYQKQNNTETEEVLSFDIDVDELKTFKSFYPWEERNKLKIHLENRGFPEFEIGKVFERVYPQQYTGKAGI